MTNAIQYLIDAIAFGSLFALMALGLALLFNVMGLKNFAYGELIMAGAYTMYYTRDFGWPAMVDSVPPRPSWCVGSSPTCSWRTSRARLCRRAVSCWHCRAA